MRSDVALTRELHRSVTPRPSGAAAPRRRRGRRDGIDGLEHATAALKDVVNQSGALDGAIAFSDGLDLRIAHTLRHQIAPRTLSAQTCPAILAAMHASEPTWLEPSAPEGFYLPPHTQLLYVPFRSCLQNTVALLAYDRRVEFSFADRHFLQRALSVDPGEGTRSAAA